MTTVLNSNLRPQGFWIGIKISKEIGTGVTIQTEAGHYKELIITLYTMMSFSLFLI